MIICQLKWSMVFYILVGLKKSFDILQSSNPGSRSPSVIFSTVAINASNRVSGGKRLFLASLQQTCDEYLYWNINKSKLAFLLQKYSGDFWVIWSSFPCSPCYPCSPNLLHVLPSGMAGFNNFCSSNTQTVQERKKEINNEKGGQNEAGHLCKCKPSVGITSSDGTCLCNHARLQVWPTGKLIDVMTDSWFLKPPYQYLKISIKCLRDKFQMFQTFIKSFL